MELGRKKEGKEDLKQSGRRIQTWGTERSSERHVCFWLCCCFVARSKIQSMSSVLTLCIAGQSKGWQLIATVAFPSGEFKNLQVLIIVMVGLVLLWPNLFLQFLFLFFFTWRKVGENSFHTNVPSNDLYATFQPCESDLQKKKNNKKSSLPFIYPATRGIFK